MLAGCDLIVTSDLPRARETLARALPGAASRPDRRFREVPIPGLPVPLLRMPSAPWRLLGRIAWLGGYAGTVESASDAYRRVASVADTLGEWATEHDHIGVVAHGFFNYLLTGALRKREWAGGSSTGTLSHWSHTTLHRR